MDQQTRRTAFIDLVRLYVETAPSTDFKLRTLFRAYVIPIENIPPDLPQAVKDFCLYEAGQARKPEWVPFV